MKLHWHHMWCKPLRNSEKEMDGGVFHGSEIPSEGVGDTLNSLKNMGAHPGTSPSFLPPVQSQISSNEGDKANGMQKANHLCHINRQSA